MRRGSGFTLVELLVCMTVLAVAMGLSYRALDRLNDASRHLCSEAERLRALVALFSRMQLDTTRLVKVSLVDGKQRFIPALRGVRAGGTPLWAEAFDLVRTGQEGATRPATRRVGYRWREGTLEYVVWPGLSAGDAVVFTTPLLTGVRAFRAQFLDGAGAWQGTWPVAGNAATTPRAVRVEIDVTGLGTVRRTFSLP